MRTSLPASPGRVGAHVDARAGIDAEFDDMRLDTTVEAGVEAGAAGVEFDTGGAVGVGVGLGGPSLAVDGWADLDVPDVSGAAPTPLPGAWCSFVGRCSRRG